MTASAWTPARIDRLRMLWLEGQTAEQIAADLKNGISRSAVLGKVHRLGLTAGRPGRPAVSKPPRPRPPADAEARPGTLRDPAPVPPALLPPSPVAEGVTLLALRRDQCRWPLGDACTGLLFCGLPVARGAFCAGHAAAAYRSPPGGTASLLALAGLA